VKEISFKSGALASTGIVTVSVILRTRPSTLMENILIQSDSIHTAELITSFNVIRFDRLLKWRLVRVHCQKFSFRSCFGRRLLASGQDRQQTLHTLLLAGSQRRCSVDRAGALKVCLRSVEIFDWKD